ncbi:hypothetical protein [Flavobacterium olei]|uniref:hypothetical protein n=1 Tax=Flavobacterium olei TaxID=1886782 RepID=UPI00321C0C47
MKTAYFLTGSCNDQDNDFELKITIADNPENDNQDTSSLLIFHLKTSCYGRL